MPPDGSEYLLTTGIHTAIVKRQWDKFSCLRSYTGDTSKTEQMAELSAQKIDYAFFCCDGVYAITIEYDVKWVETIKDFVIHDTIVY